MPSSGSSARFARSSSPGVSCDDGRVIHHLLAVRSAFRHSHGNDDRIEVCNLKYDARARAD